MRIAEVASASGVPASTLRFYERLGLIHPERESNGYRLYDEDSLRRLRFIQTLKSLGLDLAQVASLTQLWENASCGEVREALGPAVESKTADLDAAAGSIARMRVGLHDAHARLTAMVHPDGSCASGCAVLEQAPQSVSVACSLAPADHEERVQEWRALAARGQLHRTGSGVRVRLGLGELAESADLARREHECCGFLTISLVLTPSGCDLSVDAPTEAEELVWDILGVTVHEVASVSR